MRMRQAKTYWAGSAVVEHLWTRAKLGQRGFAGAKDTVLNESFTCHYNGHLITVDTTQCDSTGGAREESVCLLQSNALSEEAPFP